MKYIWIVTKMDNGEVLGIFKSQRKADNFVFLSGECDGFSTRTTQIKADDYQ